MPRFFAALAVDSALSSGSVSVSGGVTETLLKRFTLSRCLLTRSELLSDRNCRSSQAIGWKVSLQINPTSAIRSTAASNSRMARPSLTDSLRRSRSGGSPLSRSPERLQHISATKCQRSSKASRRIFSSSMMSVCNRNHGSLLITGRLFCCCTDGTWSAGFQKPSVRREILDGRDHTLNRSNHHTECIGTRHAQTRV